MMAWQVIALLVLLAAFALAFVAGKLERRRHVLRLQRSNRIINWDAALSRVRAGRGVIVENITSLPGRIWWIEECDVVEKDALYEEVAERGLLVTEAPSAIVIKETFAAEGRSERLRRLDSEPFSD
jgi:hypothetical protein